MSLADYDFDLPDDRIARFPADRRDESRLLVIDRQSGQRTHARFSDLPSFLDPSWALIMNDARVLPARLRGTKQGSGGKVEVLLVEEVGGPRRWRAMVASSKPLKVGGVIALGDETARVVEVEGEGFVVLELSIDGGSMASASGELPLPPYMGRAASELDLERYQTVYADPLRARSVAAPTAGLHFTPEVLAALDARGIRRMTITLDVGPGTFLPVRAARIEDHVMHQERYLISPACAELVREASTIVAVGTTSVRALESAAIAGDGVVRTGPGATRLFMRPPVEPQVVDHLITNFHLPRSTLLMLVATFLGRELTLDVYRDAITRGYRFYSYGDAMLIR